MKEKYKKFKEKKKKEKITKGEKFLKEMVNHRKKYTRELNTRVCYSEEYDIFSMIWGKRKVDSTIELNLLGEGDLRFDITRNGMIVGLEIENFTNVLKKFKCDERGVK